MGFLDSLSDLRVALRLNGSQYHGKQTHKEGYLDFTTKAYISFSVSSAQVFGKLPADLSLQWPTSILFTVLMLSILNTLVMNSPFILNLIWWVLASALFYGLGIFVMQKDKPIILQLETLAPINAGAAAVSRFHSLCLSTPFVTDLF